MQGFERKTIFIDLFGGSGLLSRTVKDALPDAQVIYNDFDGYHKRIENIDRTNVILSDIRDLLANVKADVKLTNEQRAAVVELIAKHELTGYVDYITLSSSLLFSMNYASSLEELSKQTMYNCVRKSDYTNAPDYLTGLDIVSMDYKELYQQYRNHPSVVFLVDPPYLSTDCSTYKSDGYWTLTEYLDVLTVIQNQSFFYFTSNKSEIIELCEWMESNLGLDSPFRDADVKKIATKVNHNSGYTDIMLYKRVD